MPTTSTEGTARGLAPIWRDLTTRYSCNRASSAIYDGIVKRYADPGRHYHTLEHIAEIIALIEEHGRPGRDHDAALFAAWFHDVIYDPRAPDNEERSADMARRALYKLDTPPELAAEVAMLVLATKGHDPAGLTREGMLFIDADLAILGADEARYRAYCDGIRKEFAWVPEEKYRMARSIFLKGFLERERLYVTDRMRDRFEAPARLNMTAELERLGAA